MGDGKAYCNMCEEHVSEAEYNREVDMCYWCMITLREQFKLAKKKK